MALSGLKKILVFLVYLAMLVLVLAFFTGNGTFIYEGFEAEKQAAGSVSGGLRFCVVGYLTSL